MKIGIIAGAFNPLTRAHVALAGAAHAHVDEIIFAIPRVFPHKAYEGASLEHRLEMIRKAIPHRVEVTEGGLFVDIASELRRPGSDVYMVCGRDAAERIVNWNYGDPHTAQRMFQDMQLLVADRQGSYQPPDALRGRIHPIALPPDFDDVSSSEVRRRIQAREDWEHLVPESIVELVRRIY